MAASQHKNRTTHRVLGTLVSLNLGCLVACASMEPAHAPIFTAPPTPAMDPHAAYKLVTESIPFQGKARLIPRPPPEHVVAFEGIIKELSFKNLSSVLEEQQVIELLLGVGFSPSDVPTMVCTAKYESQFNPTAVGRNLNKEGELLSRDLGLWQINDVNWKLCGIASDKELFEPKTNARCAKKVFDTQGISAWVAYKKNEATCKKYVLASR